MEYNHKGRCFPLSIHQNLLIIIQLAGHYLSMNNANIKYFCGRYVKFVKINIFWTQQKPNSSQRVRFSV